MWVVKPKHTTNMSNIATTSQINQIASMIEGGVAASEIHLLKRTHHGVDFSRKNPLYCMKVENFTAIMDGESISRIVRL